MNQGTKGKMKLLLVILVGLLSVAGLVFAFAQKSRDASQQVRPRRISTPAPGSISKLVKAGGDFQAALHAARPGDTIILEAGAKFTGPFTLPAKPATNNKEADWITIRTSAPDSSLPAGKRIGPSHSSLLPKILSPGNNMPALRTEMNAHHYRLIGIEFAPIGDSAVTRELVVLGSSDDRFQNKGTLTSVPHHLVLDRCYIHSLPGNTEVVRGVSLNSAHTDIINSYISEIHGTATDSQAIFSWNGPGPYNIINNHLEATSENLAFGNGEGTINEYAHIVADNVLIQGNYLYKPATWRGVYGNVKNCFEIKEGTNIRFEGNICENNWADGQSGNMLVFTTGHGPSYNITVTNNIFRHSGAGVGITNYAVNPNQHDITIRNNLFEDISAARWGGTGIFINISGTANVTVDHNTVFHDGTIVNAYDDSGKGTKIPGFVFTNNIAAHNAYGIFGGSFGNTAIANFFPGGKFRRNIIAGVPSFLDVASTYPADNFYPASLNVIGFTDRLTRSYRLAATSRYKARSTDGKDIGCDFDALDAATSGAKDGSQQAK